MVDDGAKKQKCWSNGRIINGSKKIPTDTFSLHYANAVWEGMRSYKQKDKTTKIYGLKEHIDRLYDSAVFMDIEIPYTKEQVMAGCQNLVDLHGGGDLYVRPIAYIEGSCDGLADSSKQVSLDIYVMPILSYAKTGIKTIISSYQKSYPFNPSQAKTAMNYGLLQVYENEARRAGADTVLLTNASGHIVEAPVANIFYVKNNIAVTPYDNGDILAGLTRKVIIQKILQNPSIMFTKYKRHMVVREKNITRADLYSADEVFLCGTYAEVTPVIEIDGRKVGNGKIGTVSKILMFEYEEIVRSVQS